MFFLNKRDGLCFLFRIKKYLIKLKINDNSIKSIMNDIYINNEQNRYFKIANNIANLSLFIYIILSVLFNRKHNKMIIKTNKIPPEVITRIKITSLDINLG